MSIRRLPARMRSIGPFSVRRLLPSPVQRKVGPWVFVDHFGPIDVPAGGGADVRPHPHCALSTVTFLFDGAIEHRDSTGGHAIVRPGEVHWMRGGHGIVHSERTPEAVRETGGRSHGLQLWCAHPDGHEEQDPRFDSYRDLPELDIDGVRVQLLAGDGWGEASPVDVTSELVYAMVHLGEGQSIALPDHEERCAYAVSGGFAVDGETADTHEMLIVDAGRRQLTATEDAVIAVLGGAAIGKRHMWWNLVHSDKARLIEQAERWRERRYPVIPGDDEEFIPAPEFGP